MGSSGAAPLVSPQPLHNAPLVIAALVMLLWSRSAAADGQDFHEQVAVPVTPSWLTLPFEYGDAAAWAKGRSGPVYRFSAAFLPGVTYGRVSAHLALQALYRNPNWDVGTGARATFLLTSLAGGFLPVRVLAEGSYLPVHQGAYFAGGGSIGLGGLLQLSPLYGYDTDLKTSFFGIRLGVDLLSLGDPIGAMTRYVPQQDVRPAP